MRLKINTPHFSKIFPQGVYGFKIQQVNLRGPPGKVAVTCRILQYYSNLHKKL